VLQRVWEEGDFDLMSAVLQRVDIQNTCEICQKTWRYSNIYISNKMQRYTVYFIWKLIYMFRVVPPLIIRSANNCIYNIWYLSHRYCYLPLSWKSWNWSNQFQILHDIF